tara:strand:+ start:881 stop:1522 length:642 start_codon:yes stop_codon:yes gene_type:complete
MSQPTIDSLWTTVYAIFHRCGLEETLGCGDERCVFDVIARCAIDDNDPEPVTYLTGYFLDGADYPELHAKALKLASLADAQSGEDLGAALKLLAALNTILTATGEFTLDRDYEIQGFVDWFGLFALDTETDCHPTLMEAVDYWLEVSWGHPDLDGVGLELRDRAYNELVKLTRLQAKRITHLESLLLSQPRSPYHPHAIVFANHAKGKGGTSV